MDRTQPAGWLAAAAGLVGYAVGVAVPYPGRAFAVAAVMVGLTVAAVGGFDG